MLRLNGISKTYKTGMESCIEAMTEVLASLARGELYNPLRSIARAEGADTLLGLMRKPPARMPGASRGDQLITERTGRSSAPCR